MPLLSARRSPAARASHDITEREARAGARPDADRCSGLSGGPLECEHCACWEAELATAIWMAVRTGALPREEGYQKLDMASRPGIQPVAIRPLWQPALTRALDSGVAVTHCSWNSRHNVI
jgi:hypothetical protein